MSVRAYGETDWNDEAFGRRFSVRGVSEHLNDPIGCVAVTHDGAPLDDVQQSVIWLATSFLAGATLQTCVTETFDADGALIERIYRPGLPSGPLGHQPFHFFIAPYPAGMFGQLCERIEGLLRAKFPIDIVISHLHDGNDGSMERRMQSYILAIHAASEAWNRLNEKTQFIDEKAWSKLRKSVVEAVHTIVEPVDKELATSIANGLIHAHETSMGSRLRLFFRRVALTYVDANKKAIDLRNKLFHDGFLQDRFSS